MCGEEVISSPVSPVSQGSPPHVRGRVASARINGTTVRITPACAGKSQQMRWIPVEERGSPPHVRGRAYRRWWEALRFRITPACAGKSPPSSVRLGPNGDHPRMCGEESFPHSSTRWNWGSPPHVRGREASHLVCRDALGITPACAGKREVTAWRKSVKKDHPRMCGEE